MIASLYGHNINKSRSSLEPNTVDMLMCLRNWFSNNIQAIKRLFHSMYLHFNWNINMSKNVIAELLIYSN